MTAPGDYALGVPGIVAFVFGRARQPSLQAEEGCLRRRPGRPSRCPAGHDRCATPRGPGEAFEHEYAVGALPICTERKLEESSSLDWELPQDT